MSSQQGNVHGTHSQGGIAGASVSSKKPTGPSAPSEKSFLVLQQEEETLVPVLLEFLSV